MGQSENKEHSLKCIYLEHIFFWFCLYFYKCINLLVSNITYVWYFIHFLLFLTLSTFFYASFLLLYQDFHPTPPHSLPNFPYFRHSPSDSMHRQSHSLYFYPISLDLPHSYPDFLHSHDHFSNSFHFHTDSQYPI